MRATTVLASLLCTLQIVACANEPIDLPTETAEQAAIYGADDRTDVYAHRDSALRELTRGAIVALMEPDVIDTRNPDDIRLFAHNLGEVYGLCSGERFTDQQAAAFCSGTLIDDDLVLTAGHCVTSSGDCSGTRLVFNYYMESDDQLATITDEDVYSCSELLVQQLSSGRENLDYAILRLDRSATPRHQPANVVPSLSPVGAGNDVTVIGFGSGLPAKIDDGGRVIDNRSSLLDYFTATTDTFGGNSGSGVFNAQNQVVGILVRGATDYVSSGSCTTVAEYDNQGSNGGESISYAYRAVQELCQGGYPSDRLCGNSGSCGDGVCSAGESSGSCPSDCMDAVCGDGTCSPGEGAGCPQDCGTDPGGVPTSWVCEPSYYGTRDGCDCNCGAIDPDCGQPGQELFNCEAGEACSADGQCVDAGSVDTPTGPPASWECPASYYGTSDGCDCECGAYDPDCDNPGQEVLGCTPGEICATDGTCSSGVDVDPESIPNDWVCPDSYFGTGDGCDCECGAYDPDCDDDDQTVYGCGFLGVCGGDGLCEFGIDLGDGAGDKEFCAVAVDPWTPTRPTWLVAALIGLVVARRRVSSSSARSQR